MRGNAIWKLASGDFDYYRWEILDVQINPSSPTNQMSMQAGQ